MQDNHTISEEVKQLTDSQTDETSTLTCSLAEAAAITGLSYDYLMGQSKVKNPKDRVPGFKVGKSTFRVLVARLPEWLDHKAELV